MRSFKVPTSKPLEALDITEKVLESVGEGKGRALLVHVPHTTAAIMVNEFEPNIQQDFETLYSTLVPERDYLHEHVDSNARAHLTASLIGNSVTIPMEGKEPALGAWQRIILMELDGPRQRSVFVQVL